MSNQICYEELKEFDKHRLVVFVYDPITDLKGFIAIHRGGSVPSFGATRFWDYPCEQDALNDALRLSKLMSYKSALAGLPYGGAKAVISSTKLSLVNKSLLFKNYARKVNFLGGHFITGSDVGVDNRDLAVMAKECPYIVGTKGDPVRFTGLGVYYGILICLGEISGKKSVKGRTFAIQGLGKTGYCLLKLLYKDAAKVFVSDIDESKIQSVKREFPKIEVVLPREIYKQKVDVYCPCALGSAVSVKNISSLKCKIIAGSANNQLETKQMGELLYKLGILYAPDYVINAGGLINVADEYENKNFVEERVAGKVSRIKKTLNQIIEKSKKEHRATNLVADEMAEMVFNKIV